MSQFSRNREFYAGGLVALIGAGAIFEGWQYGIGGLSRHGLRVLSRGARLPAWC